MLLTGNKGSSLHVKQEEAATERGLDRPPTPLRSKEWQPTHLINAAASNPRHPFLIVNIINNLPHNHRHGFG